MQTLQAGVDFKGRIGQYGIEICRILLTEFEKVQMSDQSCRVSFKTEALKSSVASLRRPEAGASDIHLKTWFKTCQ